MYQIVSSIGSLDFNGRVYPSKDLFHAQAVYVTLEEVPDQKDMCQLRVFNNEAWPMYGFEPNETMLEIQVHAIVKEPRKSLGGDGFDLLGEEDLTASVHFFGSGQSDKAWIIGFFPNSEVGTLEFSAVTEAGLEPDCLGRLENRWSATYWFIDMLFDSNSVWQFWQKKDKAWAAMTAAAMCCTTSAVIISAKLQAGSHKEATGLWFFKLLIDPIVRGRNNVDSIRVHKFEALEGLVCCFITPYALMIKQFDWDTGVMAMFFSTLSSAYSVSSCVDFMMLECAGNIYFDRIVTFLPGVYVRKLQSVASLLSFVLTFVVLGSAVHHAYPDEWRVRWPVLCLLVWTLLASWEIMLKIGHSIVFKCCNIELATPWAHGWRANGLLRVHMKRHLATPALHVAGLCAVLLWKLMAIKATLFCVPGTAKYLPTLFETEWQTMSVQNACAWIWVFSSGVSLIAFSCMVVIAQCGIAYPGLSFAAPIWPCQIWM